ncbi:MAG: response regulator transcription factor [Candidatus Neomarinimicrobiota bacterium]
MINVILADDHPIFRKGLSEILQEAGDIQISGEAANAREIFTMLDTVDCNILILDIKMPGQSGLDILKQLNKTHPNLKILVLSMHPEEQYAIRVLRAGASGYLNKETVPEDIVRAVRRINSGRKFITESIADQLARSLGKDFKKRRFETLSDREYELMCMIATGKTLTTIANDLSLSIKTVSTYRTRLLQKMKMKSNAELTHYAISNNLVD